MVNNTRVRQASNIRAAGLRQVLDDRGIRYIWLANKLGISKGHMSGLIAGRYNVPERHAERICEVLGVDFSSAFEFTNDRRIRAALDDGQ